MVESIKIFVTIIYKTLKKTCTIYKYVGKRVKTYYNNQYWITSSKLWTKFSFCPMNSWRLYQNLNKTTAISILPKVIKYTFSSPKLESWQLKVLLIKKFYHNYWLINLAADIYVCNNHSLIIKYHKKLIKIEVFILDRSSSRKKKI